jgi:LSD1 subclass zinc finger protein
MQETDEIKKENVSRFTCSSCGANMIFNPGNQRLQCTYCETIEKIESKGTIDETRYDLYLEKGIQNLQPMAQNAMQVSCESCGATVNFTPPETTDECDFCAAKIVALPKSADLLISPNGILPLGVTASEAKEYFQEWIRSRWFVPNKLKKLAKESEKHSIYIPYWMYDGFANSDYTGQRGVTHYTTETYYENGERKTRQTSHTEWTSVSGSVFNQFENVSIAATKSVPRKYLDKLEPWTLSSVKSYDPAYLSGHKAQTYQVPLEESYELFKDAANKLIYSEIRSDIGGDQQRIDNVSSRFSDITFKHLLLPVYALAYLYKSGVYQVFINGRTGEVQGERPYSFVKIIGLIFLILFVIVYGLHLLHVFGIT